MFEIPQDSSELISKEKSLQTFGFGNEATPTQIIEAYIALLKNHKDEVLSGNYSEELIKIKSAYNFLEQSYSTESQDSMKKMREIEEDSLSKEIHKSTNEMAANIKSGVDELWGIFR